jgi:hypothetical protein
MEQPQQPFLLTYAVPTRLSDTLALPVPQLIRIRFSRRTEVWRQTLFLLLLH